MYTTILIRVGRKVGTAGIVFALSLSVFTLGVSFANAQTADTTPPTMPTGVTATVVSPNQINVSWTASTDNVAVAGYRLYRDGTLIATPTATTYSDYNLSPRGYTYTVAAYDAAGNVSFISAGATATIILDTTPPTPPTSVTVSANATTTPSTATITVTWSGATDNILVTGYRVYRNAILITTGSQITGTSLTDTVSPGTYHYVVVAYDAAGNYSPQSPASPDITIISDTLPPSSPAHLVAAVISPTQVSISWTASTDNVGVAGYYVYRGGTQIATVASTSYIDSGLVYGSQYTYTAAAYDFAGNVSYQSWPVTATTPPQDTLPPTNPTNLQVVAVNASSVILSWGQSLDNVAVAGYYIYREGVQIGTTSSTSYTDTNLSLGTYHYNVAAYDTSGNISAQSLPTSATVLTLQGPAPVVTPPLPPAAPPAPTSSSTPTAGGTTMTFTKSLYYGSRGDQVKALQLFLAAKGYIDASNATGFFGKLTEAAVKKFQCDKGLVCSGSPASTGWGFVGARTRKTLNGS